MRVRVWCEGGGCGCAQLALLSPVHTAAYRCEPLKKARVSTKGRRAGYAFFWPSMVPIDMSRPYLGLGLGLELGLGLG